MQKFKIVMVGDQNAGKSSIIIRYVKNDFDRTSNVSSSIYSQPLGSISLPRISQYKGKPLDCNCGILLGNKGLEV
jgi:GTPase SAR1 family protein